MKKDTVKVEETMEAVQAEAPVAEEKKETGAKRPGRPPKTAEPKETGKKKPGRPPKKADEKTAAQTVQAVLEYQGNAIEVDKIEEKVKAQFVAEGHRAGNIKDLSIYIKPEDGKAYYVINGGKFDGKVDLF